MSHKALQKNKIKTIKIVAIYVLLGFAWIYVSDTLLGWLKLDPAVTVRIAVVKGSLFLLCTATLMYLLINRFVQQLVFAENRQIESLKNYQVIFNATNEAIFIHDTLGETIFDVNDSMLDMYGYKRNEALAVDIRHLSAGEPPYSKVESDEKIRRTIFEGPQIFEWLSRRKTGELFWSEVSLNKVTINNNNRLIAVVRDISERKQAEEAATNSNNLIQTVINTAPMSIFFKDKELRYVGCNNAFAKDAGVERPEDLVGKNDFHLPWKEYASLYRCDDRNIIISGASKLSYDEPLITPKGKQIWIRISKVPLRNKANKIIGVLGMYEDITDRKIAEKINKRLLLRQQAILDNLPMMAWLKDTNSHLEMINEPYAKACGHTVEDCIGKTDFDLFPEEMAKRYRADDREVCNSGQKKQFEESIATPDGIKWHLTYKSPIYDEQGVITGTTGIAQDITERKRTEEALRESEERWRLAISASPIPIMLHDEDNRVLQLSAGWTRFSGYTIEDIPWYTDWTRLAYGERKGLGKDYIDQVFSINQTEKYGELIVTAKDGSKRIWDFQTTPLGKPNGSKRVLHSIAIDVTESKRAEEERGKLESELQAQKMESVALLAGGVAHDFNNMLGVILGHADMAKEQVESTHPLFADLEKIHDAAERSTILTRQLLTFARKQNVAPIVLDLNETVEGRLTMLRRLIGENINLFWMPGAGLWPVKVDPAQIDQILANLCVNARDAIAGVGKITVETGNITFDNAYCGVHGGSVPGDYVRISLNDNGCGMDHETMGRIFEPFFTTKGIGEGTGLGLASVYGAVKQNKGIINVDSKPGKGTTFSIYLPRHEGGSGQERKPDLAEHAMRGHETILLVEDDSSLLDMISTMLQKIGYTVIAANSTSEACKLAEVNNDTKIDLLLTDVIMPEMNGRDLAEHLLRRRPQMKCLFMSGYTANIISNQGVINDGLGFLQKPFSKKVLASKVREALDSGKGRAF